MSWSRQFDDPIPLPDRELLRTLRDAANYITGLPAKEAKAPHWQLAMRCLIDAADHDGIVMLARVAMLKAMNASKPPRPVVKRKKKAKKYTIVRSR